MVGEPHPGRVTSAELTFFRAVLLSRSSGLAEGIADAAGLSAPDAARASARLVRRGALSDRPEYALRPRFEHAASRALAARAAATPISWAREPNALRDPQDVRANIAAHVPLWGRMRGYRVKQFMRLEGDGRRAAALLLAGVSGFELSHWFADLVDAAYLFESSAWSTAAECFAEGSLRRTIGQSLAAGRTLPGLPPMLIVDHSRTNCSVCRLSVDWREGRHAAVPGAESPLRRGCGVVWTHYTGRAWLAELDGWVGPDGEARERMEPLEELPDLQWLDP